MEYFDIEFDGVKRRLPIVAIGPHIKVASVNLLGDTQLVDVFSKQMADKLKEMEFDTLVGPEVKVVALLHELSKVLKKDKYVICRKEVHGYMVRPVVTKTSPPLVLDGRDAEYLKGKKVVIVDDVVSSGRTMRLVEDLMKLVGADVVARSSVFRQGDIKDDVFNDLITVGELPVFKS